MKNKRFIGYFVNNQASPFYQSEVFSAILKYVQKNTTKVRLKEDKGKLSLTLRDVETVEEARKALESIVGNFAVVS